MPKIPRYYSVTEVVKISGFCRRTIMSKIYDGSLPAAMVASQWRISADDLRKWMKGKTTKQMPTETER